MNLTIDPKAYKITAGTYHNNVLIKTNTNLKNDLFPLTINVIGKETFSAVDTVNLRMVKIGFDTESYAAVKNEGSANGFVTEVGFDNAQFSLVDNLPLELNALAAWPLRIKFKPSVTGESKATMTMHFNDGTQKNM